MVLSKDDIKAYVKDGRLKFYEGERHLALDELKIGPASIDLRIGYTIKTLKRSGKPIILGGTIDDSDDAWEKKVLEIGPHGAYENYRLRPGEFVLAMTRERFQVPKHLIAMVEGRSYYARLGLSVHQSAPWLQPGWSGQIELEIYNSGNRTVELVPGETRPCQVVFMQLSSPVRRGYDESPESRYPEQSS